MGNLKDLLKKANQANGGGEDVDSFVDRLKEERQKRSGVTAEQYWQSRDSYNDYLKSVQTINRVRGRDKLVTDYFDDATSFMKSYADGTKNINWDMAMSKDKKKVFDNEYNSLMEREKNLRSFLQDEGISKEYRDQLAEALDSSHWSIVRAKVHRRNLTNYFSQYKSQDDWFNNAPENYEQRIKKYEDAKSKSNVPDSLSWMGDVLDNIGYGDAAPEGFEDYLKVDKYGYSRYDYDLDIMRNQKYLPKYEKMEYIELAKAKSELPDGEEKEWLDNYIQGRKEDYLMSLDGKAIEDAEKAYKNRFGDASVFDAVSQSTSEQDYEIVFNHLEAFDAKEMQKKAKEKEKYLGVGDPRSEYYDPDFAKKAAAGDEEFGALAASYIIGTGSVQEGFELSQLNDKERDTLHYHYHEGGLDGAKEYLEHLQPDLARRYADYRYEKMEGNTFLEIAFGIEAGLNQFANGLEGWFTDEAKSYDSTEILQGYVSNDLADVGPKIPFTGGKTLGQAGFDTVTTLSNMAPTLAISTVAPTTGAVLMGASAGGNAYQEKLRAGYSADEAAVYGILVGTSEALLERFIGSAAKVSGKGLTKLTGKALDSMDNVFSRFAKTWGGQVLLNAGSEGLEEFLQAVLEPYLWRLASGEEATVELEEAIYSALMGAFTGGMLGGGMATVKSGGTAVKQTKTGRSVLNANKTEGLIGISNDTLGIAPDSSKRYLEKQIKNVGDKVSSLAEKNAKRAEKGKSAKEAGWRTAKAVGKLYDTVSETTKKANRSQDVADISARLKELGRSDHEKMADAIVASVNREELSGSQVRLLKTAAESKAVQTVLDEIVNNPESDYSKRRQALSEFTAEVNLSSLVAAAKKASAKEKGVKLSEAGKTVNPDGFVEEDGELRVKTDDGTVSHEDMRYDSKEQGIAYETIYGLGITDAAEANLLLNGHTEADGLTDSEWSEGVTDAFLFGRAGVDIDALATTPSTAKLLDTQRMDAYRMGQTHMGETDTQDNIDLRNALKEEGKRLKRKPGEKGVYVRNQDGSYTKVSDYMEANKDLNKRQTTAIRVMQEFSDVMGARVNLFQAFEENGKKYYINHLGKKIEGNPNGFYDKSTGEIYVAMDAGATQANAFTDTMLFTFAHEVTHFIKDWSPTHFEKIASTLIRQAGFDGKMADLIADQQDKAMRIRKEKISEETALEELVADSMETILRSGRVVETMAKIKKVDAEAHAKLKGWFKKLRRFLRRMVNVYGNQNANTAEGKIVEGFAEDLLQQLEQLFAEGAVEAGKNYKAARDQDIDALAEDGIVFDEATGSVFALRDSFATNDVLSVGRKNFDVKAVAKMISNVTGRSIEDSEKLVRSEMTIANMVLANPEFLDFAADSRYEAIKKNSDYPQGTVDLSNLCPKREEFTAMFDLLQKTYPNKLFTAQDIAEMRKILSDAGITVACGACFVEDRRQLIGEIADTFIGMWTDAVNTGGPLKKTNADGKKIDLLVTKELATRYGLTPGTKIVATDTYIPNQYDLTTYEGFRLLEKNHPQIAMSFTRYNNSRGQQSARLIEGRAEYKRQILGWSPAKVKSVNNNGGLRIFSFSDFEVVHLLDLVQVVIDCAAKGVKIHGYTKIPAFAKLVRNTGIKLNRSLIPLGDLGYHMEGGKVVLDYDSTEGININDDNFLDERDNPDVGNIVIGINPTQIGAAMLDPFIDYIIPFHSNKAKAILKKLGTGEWINYKESQHERDISTGKASKKNVNIYTQVINKYNPRNKVDFVNAFLKECQKQGKIPRYAEFLNKEYTESGAYQDEYGAFNYTYREGYHKLLVDFKMFDSNGNILPQGEITPDLDNEFMQELLNAEVDRKRSYQFPQEVYDAIDEEFGEQTTMYSDRFVEDKYFSRQIDKFNNLREGSYVTVGKITTGSPIEKVGIPAGKLYFDVSKIRQEMIDRKDPIPPETIKGIPKVLDNPMLITEFVDKNGRHSINVYGKLYIGSSPVVIGIMIGKHRNGQTVDKIQTVHPNRNFLDEVTDSNTLYLGENKKETNAWFQALGAQEPPLGGTKYGFIRMVSQPGVEVKKNSDDGAKMSDRDEGQTMLQERDTGAAKTKLRRQRDAAKDKARSVSKDLRTMEKEFLRLVKQYDRVDAKAGKAAAKSATRIDDLKAALRKEAASHRDSRKTWEAEFTRLLREYERSDRNVDRLEERLQRQRDAIEAKAESIKKTVVKHSIRKKIMNLNKLFTRGTKEKNVKAGMRDFAASALASADILFTDTVTNQDLIRNGIGTELTEDESKLLKETVDLMAKINDLSGYDNLAERDKLEAKMKRNMTALRDVFTRERARLEKATIAGVLNDLAEEYHKLESTKEPHLKNTYSESVYQYLKALQETVGGTKIKDMSLSQLESLNKAYEMVLGTIQAANKLFRNGRYEDAAARTDRVQSELKKISASEKDPAAKGAKVADFLRSFTWNELRPVDAFERLGSEAMKELFWDLVYAQGEFGRMAKEIAAAFENARKKHGYSKWDLNTAKEYDTVDGKKFRVTLLDRMSIYAYSKRPQASDHMTDGGFVFDSTSTYTDEKSGVKRMHKKLSSPYRLSNADITEIANSLNEAEKAYVDEIQKFMKEFGERGNKVSRALYGVDLFTEEAYFPLQSEKDYISTTDQALNSTATMVSLKNTGMTKPTVPHANNPIVLRAFDDIVLDHLDTMSKYIAYVLPIENIQKVYNSVGRVVTGDNGYVSTQALIGSKFGAAAQQYFEQFIKDLNGASFTSGAKSPFDGLFSKGKAAAIAANASVMIQQYSAVIRAMSEISPQYMIPFLNASASRAADGKIYDELIKYAPVAVIKEMGGYDTGSSRTLKEYVQYRNAPMSTEKAMSKAKDAFSWGAQQMDKIGWSTIWRAVKKEIADTTNLKIGSEEFLQACGKRFTEVVTKTQVYDSVISRSGFMRSKHSSVKYLTTYMGEPTVIVGMLFTSHLELVRAIKSRDGRRIWKAARKTLRTGMAVAGSSIANELLKALVYAGRDDDEDEAYLERVAKHFGDGLSGQLSPLNLFNLLPGTRDIVSLFEGFDVDRPDVTLIGDLIKSSFKLYDAFGDEDADLVEASLNFLGDLGNMFGIPAENIIRDVKATFNFYDDMADEIYPTNVGGAFAEGFTGEEPTKHENLYDVIVRGEKSRIDALKKGYVDEDGNFDQDKYDTAVRKALRDGDQRIRKAAIAYHNGNYTEYDSIMDEIEAEGNFDREIIVGAVKAQHSAMFPSPTDSSSNAKAEYDGDDLRRAIVSGDADEIGLVKDNMIQTDIANGKTEEEASESFMSKARSEIKKAFKEDSIDEEEAVDLLVEYGQEEEAAVDTVNHLAFQLDYPEYKELSMTDVRDWYEYAEGVVPLGIYYDFTMKAKDIEGDDRNGDGKADSGSKKRKLQELARSYGLTGAQIRALMNTQ